MPLEGFRNNRNFVIEAVRENAEALRYAADGFLNDRDLVKDAAKAKAEALRYASAGFRSDRKFVIEAVQENAEYEARLRIYRLSQYKVVNTSRGALRGVCRSNPQASGPQRELLAPHPGGFPGLPRRGYSLLGLAPGWPSVSGGHQGCGRRLGATGRHAAA